MLIGQEEEEENERMEAEKEYRIHYMDDEEEDGSGDRNRNGNASDQLDSDFEFDDDDFNKDDLEEFNRKYQQHANEEREGVLGNVTPEKSTIIDRQSRAFLLGQSTFIQPTMEEMMRGVQFSDDEENIDDKIEMCEDSLA